MGYLTIWLWTRETSNVGLTAEKLQKLTKDITADFLTYCCYSLYNCYFIYEAFRFTVYLLVDLCRTVLKNNHLEQRNLSKKSEIRFMRHTRINLFNKYGKPVYFIKKEGSALNSSISLKNEVWFHKYIQEKELPEIIESVPNFFTILRHYMIT